MASKYQLIWITDLIALGSTFEKEDIPAIKKRGVSAIVDVRSEGRDDQALIEQSGMRYLHIEVDDRRVPSKEQFDAIFKFVLPIVRAKKKVLVHCHFGHGRSPIVVIAILVELGMDVGEALQLVKQKHMDLAFTEEQEEFIRGMIKSADWDW